jgi:DivIVA domain-containing protein
VSGLVALDRRSIVRHDFPATAGGYDPSAVDAHLSAVADEVERALGGAAPAGAGELRDRAEAAAGELRRLLSVLAETSEQVEAALRRLSDESFVATSGVAAAGAGTAALGVTVAQAASSAGDEEVGDEPALAAVDEAPAGGGSAEQG